MKRLFLYLLLTVQAAGLAALYAYHAAADRLPGYLLETHPVDPRDLLRGDFVILGYDIGELPVEYDPAQFPGGQAFVTLEPVGEFWKIQNVTPTRPATDSPVLRARLQHRRLIYGIEKYFVPEGQGNPPLPLTVEIVIHSDDQAQIRQLYAEGLPWPR